MDRYEIRDISLAPDGHRKIEWVRNNMPLLRGLEKEFSESRPFEGVKIALSVHLEAKTAYLCRVLAAGGARMSVTGSNVLSTKDEIAAALAEDGMSFCRSRSTGGSVLRSYPQNSVRRPEYHHRRRRRSGEYDSQGRCRSLSKTCGAAVRKRLPV